MVTGRRGASEGLSGQETGLFSPPAHSQAVSERVGKIATSPLPDPPSALFPPAHSRFGNRDAAVREGPGALRAGGIEGQRSGGVRVSGAGSQGQRDSPCMRKERGRERHGEIALITGPAGMGGTCERSRNNCSEGRDQLFVLLLVTIMLWCADCSVCTPARACVHLPPASHPFLSLRCAHRGLTPSGSSHAWTGISVKGLLSGM